MKWFVQENSVVREMWGKSDIILFIFAGAAAEFALNKAVDWLYFTGVLPSDPLGRLFSTVAYARKIVFATEEDALQSIGELSRIHQRLEEKRGYVIPDWAYRDVLYMLIHYSIASYELLERKLDEAEKEEVFSVFYRVGSGMGLKELPTCYLDWQSDREKHLEEDLRKSEYTKDLFLQYKKHLGQVRYRVLCEGQKLVVPQQVKVLSDYSEFSLLKPLIPMYKLGKVLRIDTFFKFILIPAAYRDQVNQLDIQKERISATY